jgi:hypothetical protein
VILALQLFLALLLIAVVIWVGDALAREMRGALGEPPLRERERPEL